MKIRSVGGAPLAARIDRSIRSIIAGCNMEPLVLQEWDGHSIDFTGCGPDFKHGQHGEGCWCVWISYESDPGHFNGGVFFLTTDGDRPVEKNIEASSGSDILFRRLWWALREVGYGMTRREVRS